MSVDAATLDFYNTIKSKLTARFGAWFVQDIPGFVGFSMQWFTKQGPHATVKVSIKESGGLRIEFTASAVIGISKTEKENCIDIELHTAIWLRFSQRDKSHFYSGAFDLSKEYHPKLNTKQLVMDLLATCLMA
jgi:hypothetical protein